MQIAAWRASTLGTGRCYCDQHPAVSHTVLNGRKGNRSEILAAKDAQCAQLGGAGGRKLTSRGQAEMGVTPFSLAAARHPPPPRHKAS